MDIIIKKAVKDDAFDISKIHAMGWKTSYKEIVPNEYLRNIHLDDWVEFLEEGIENKTREAHIIYVDNIPAGAISHGPARKEDMKDFGEIISFYMHPVYRGLGLGSMLLKHTLEYMRAYGKIYLYVFEKNILARKFYEKNGFTNTNSTASFTLGGKEIIDLQYIYFFK